jgi:hypothetical protein
VSQEINLINPALRPQRDWFSSRSVAPALVAALVLVGALFGGARYQLADAQKRQAHAAATHASALQRLKSLQEMLAARKNDPVLEREVARLATELKQREDVLQLARGLAGEGGGVADVMRGFSRQRVEGVWLTDFSVGPAGIDIRGRLLDPALLPAYIRRLNGEPAFRGRQFAALDMKGVVPQPPAAAGQPAAAPAAPAAPLPAPGDASQRYVEFVLHASQPVRSGKEGKE